MRMDLDLERLWGSASSSREGRGRPMVLWTVLMTLCGAFLSAAEHPAYHTVMLKVSMLSMTDGVDGHQQLLFQMVFPENSPEAQMLLGLLHCRFSVGGPSEIFGDVYPKEFN